MAETWSKEEKDFLFEHVGKIKVSTLAERLNRPLNGVVMKMRRLGIGNIREHFGAFTMGELAGLLKVDRKTVENWGFNHGLPYTQKTIKCKKVFYFIDTIDFWNWAYVNQERIDFSKIEPKTILPEPDWVKPLRLVKKNPKGNYYRNWTLLEEKKLLELAEDGYSYFEIGEILDRSVLSVDKKHSRLLQKKR